MDALEIKETKYMTFTKYHFPKKKTYDIFVHNHYGDLLGVIKWYGGWRRYCFYSQPNMLFDSKCMKELTEYIDNLMKERIK